jgi:predicted alpha/beta superfamily hydrolase
MQKEHTIVGNLKIVNLRYEGFLVNKNRKVRIWTPESYNKNAKVPYKVIYMWDGQNVFDDATSYAGEWCVDETITEEEEKGIRPCVVVGLDCSPDRLSEYLPKFSNIAIDNLGYKGSQTLDFLMNTVIPYVENHYNVSDKREDISIGGSSMGGLMSLAAAISFPTKFSKIYAFSSAFSLFKYGINEDRTKSQGLNNDKAFEYVIKKFKEKNMKNNFKIVMTSGGVGLEAEYLRYTDDFRKKLLKSGWNENNLLILQDETMEHNEYQWSTFFPTAYEFVNK